MPKAKLDLAPLTLDIADTDSWLNVGAFSLFADMELPKGDEYKFYEIYPPKGVKPDYRPLARSIGNDVRSLEVWWDGEIARIICGCVDPTALNPFQSAYEGVDFKEIDEKEPEWVGELKEAPMFFDVEQLHGLSFCRFVEEHRGELLNQIIGSLSPDCVAWIQIATMTYDWSEFAENFSQVMQSTVEDIKSGYMGLTPTVMKGRYPLPTAKAERKEYDADVRGSTVAKHGNKIAQEGFEKGQMQTAFVHIRGLVSGTPEALHILNSGLTASIKVSYDFVGGMPYDDPRFLRWLRERVVPIPERFLSNLGCGSFLNEWTVGYEDGKRTLIPVFCVVPSEYSIFNCLPTDRDLPVSYCEPKPPRPTEKIERKGARV